MLISYTITICINSFKNREKGTLHINSNSFLFESDDIRTPIYKLGFDENFSYKSYTLAELMSLYNMVIGDKDIAQSKNIKKQYKTSVFQKRNSVVQSKASNIMDSFNRPLMIKIKDFEAVLEKGLRSQNNNIHINTDVNEGTYREKSRKQAYNNNSMHKIHDPTYSELIYYLNEHNINVNKFLELVNNINNNFTYIDKANNSYAFIIIKGNDLRKIARDHIANYEDDKDGRSYLFVIEGGSDDIQCFLDDAFVFTEGTKNTDENELINLVVTRKLDTLTDELKMSEETQLTNELLFYSTNELEKIKEEVQPEKRYLFICRSIRILPAKYQHGLFIISNKGMCIFTAINNNHKKKNLKFQLKDIKALVRYRYLLQHKSMNIFLFGKKSSIIFDFECEHEFNEVYDYLMENAPKVDRNYNDLKYHTNMWVDGMISNYDYLIYLNTVGCRSFVDLSQYPIMPWVITNFEDSEGIYIFNTST